MKLSEVINISILILSIGILMTSCTKENSIIDNTLKTTDGEFYSDNELDERNTQLIKVRDNIGQPLKLDINGKERLRFTNRFVKKGGNADLRNLVTSKNVPYPRDIIDLRAIDANTNTAEDDAFVISNNGLTGKAGQLSITIRSGSGYNSFYLYYSIKKVELKESSFLAAIAVDDRTKKVELIAEENIPTGYKMIFLFFSDYFIGKVDSSRQSLNISSSELNIVQAKFRNEIAKIIETKIPSVKERNTKTKLNLQNKYPHLNGYFDAENIGYISRVDILKNAQDKFFKAQKEILEASHLNDEQYEKSLEISARALTEYILFRQQTIKRLKSTTKENSEAEIHRLFATMRNEGKFEKENATEDIYRNNSWLLDDKFMTYETLLSDRELSELVSFITDGEDAEAVGRPDLAFVFSNNPNNKKPFDVVIVELKKRGVKLKEKMSAITQLEERARKLSKYYKNQIQRIWYYGIIDIDEETELALSGQFTELYSTGKMFYRELPVAISIDPLKRVPIAVFIWDLDAVIDDASSRNSAFLNLLKSKFSNQ